MINYNTTLSNKEIDKIETKEETKEIKGNNTLAIMVKSKDGKEYTPSDTNTWPTGEYKYAGSLCIGNDGRDIEESEVISFNNDNHTATITTKDTIYCYLYFTEGEDAITRIESKSGDSLENKEDVSAREDVLRRFQGDKDKVQNNYICFGTSITEECVKNTDRYMYRIIGYAIGDDDETTNTKKGQLKLIKTEALEEAMPWHYNHNDNVNWFQSDLYKRISTSAYLQNSYYVPSGWENKIADHSWWAGDILSYRQGGAIVYKIETGKAIAEYNVLNMESGSKTWHVEDGVEGDLYYGKDIKYDTLQGKWTTNQNEKVGLMNASDYYLAYGGDESCAFNANCVNTWIHLSNNDSTTNSVTKKDPPSGYEWLMSRMGFDYYWGMYGALDVESDGSCVNHATSLLFSVRPVIYTVENITLNGSGTITDPFIIIN